MAKQTILTPFDQWFRTVEYVLPSPRNRWKPWARPAFIGCAPYDGERFWIGRIIANTRHCRAGDILLWQVSNGFNERMPVFGVSSRGHRLRHFYMKLENEGGPLQIIDVPESLHDLSIDHAEVFAFVEKNFQSR